MIICSFLGHKDIYDEDIYEKLTEAVFNIAELDDTVEFQFCSTGYFYALCLAAVLEAKQRFPQKNIAIVIVARSESREYLVSNLKQNKIEFPLYIADKVISPPPGVVTESERDMTLSGRQLERWTIRRSMHIISYVYPVFFDSAHMQHRYAGNRGIAMTDITNPETTEEIRKNIQFLPERQKTVITMQLARQSWKEIAAACGTSIKTAHSDAVHACIRLQRDSIIGVLETFRRTPHQPIVCCILAIGEADYNSLCLFEQAILFLFRTYHVARFKILLEYCHSGYMYILEKLAEKFPEIKISLFVDTKIKDSTGYRHHRQAEKINTILRQSDFCIWYPPLKSPAHGIAKQLEDAEQIKVLDMGGNGPLPCPLQNCNCKTAFRYVTIGM